MRRASKTDTNQADIVDAARKAGASVALTYQLGGGYPDVTVGIAGVTMLWEIKTLTGKLTGCEPEWHATWKGHVAIVRTQEEAVWWVEWARDAGEMLRGRDGLEADR